MNIDLRKGNNLDVLKKLPDNSVDSIVTDPPYGLSFMGKKWDYDVPSVDLWKECLRVLKPGGHLLAFAGTRTQHRMAVRIEDAGFEIRDMIAWVYGSGFPKSKGLLKPALEPITMARKKSDKLTLLNIDSCRVGDEVLPEVNRENRSTNIGTFEQQSSTTPERTGRWPANLIHDGSEDVIEVFNNQSRFFYCAKASKKDRDEGLDGFKEKQVEIDLPQGGIKEGNDNRIAVRKNFHPTVKPTDLMRYLCRLVTPPGGTVLDPFMGSGSTGKAAMLEGFSFLGMELDDEYFKIAEARINHAKNKQQEKQQ
jgi:site-specific DNA-methyltransferase (adenine-specific)